ncbi:MAG TPA: pseudouridine synthase [Candidatus Paceibacterota bacterium]|nr:pseudouridine synthase [Candidatus Paceibacterota bacterium]
MHFPIRLNKYLAEKNIAARRGADLLIAAGKIKINGQIAKLGDKVWEKDVVEIADEIKRKKYSYLAYHKPVGIVTHSPQPGEKEIKNVANLPKDVFPIGRLDKDSAGLIILTNDGRLTDRLLNPKLFHEKEYRVTLDKPITNTLLLKIKEGLKTSGFKARPAKIRKIAQEKFEMILTEGKNRQIRRMAAALGFAVRELVRIRVMNIRLGNLAPNQFRPIEGEELKELLQNLKIS